VTSRLLVWILLLACCYALEIRLPAVAVYWKSISAGVPTTFRDTFEFVHVARNGSMREGWGPRGECVTFCTCKLRIRAWRELSFMCSGSCWLGSHIAIN